MFWNNVETLLAPGPTGIGRRVAELLEHNSQQHLRHVGDSGACAMNRGMAHGADRKAAAPVATDAHHLKPRGCDTQHPLRMHEVATGAPLMHCAQTRLFFFLDRGATVSHTMGPKCASMQACSLCRQQGWCCAAQLERRRCCATLSVDL